MCPETPGSGYLILIDILLPLSLPTVVRPIVAPCIPGSVLPPPIFTVAPGTGAPVLFLNFLKYVLTPERPL